MKTILILTDFSENAACAAEAGLALSAKLNTDLLLFNTYIDYAILPYESGDGWDINGFSLRKQRSTQRLESLTEGLEFLAGQLDPAAHKPAVNFRSENCDLGMEVAEIIKQNDIELIVMGARTHFPDDPLPGADTSAVIKNASRPVLVVPAKTDLFQIRKIIFATDFDEQDFIAIRYLMKLGKLLNYQLDIIHVSKPGQDKITAKELDFKEQIKQTHYQGLSYRKVNDKDLVARLNELTGEGGPAILALLHHRLPFVVRLFSRSKTKAALARQHTPLLIFPSRMQ
jgi:nucleotide-binding universal stress UspA family protein